MRLLRLFLALLLLGPAAPHSAPSRAAGEGLEAASLRSIAAWLKASGRDGWLAAEVADVAGIPRAATEDLLEARQRGFRSGEVLRIAQTSPEAGRDFLIFMAQHPDGEVRFYFATPTDGLKKAFVSSRIAGIVALPGAEAAAAFREELKYWRARVEGR